MAPSDARSPEQIEADSAAVRNRLTGSIEAFIDQVHPNRVKQRTIARIRAAVQEKVDQAKGLVFTPGGQLRTERVALAGGGIAGLITLVSVLRAIGRRGRRRRLAAGPTPRVGVRRKR